MQFPKCISSVACFSDAIVCLKSNGTLWALGKNTNGRFGVDPSTTERFNTWTQLGMDNVKHVFAVNNQGLYVTRDDEEVWYTGFPANSRLTGTYTKAITNTWTQAPIKSMRGFDIWSGCLFVYTNNGSLYSTYGIDGSLGFKTTYNTLTKSKLLTDIVQIAGTTRTYDTGVKSSHDGNTYVFPVLITAAGEFLWRNKYSSDDYGIFKDSGKRYLGEYYVSTVKNIKQCYINCYREVYSYINNSSKSCWGTRNGENYGIALLKNGDVYAFINWHDNTSSSSANSKHGLGFSDTSNHNWTKLSITNVKQIFSNGVDRTFFLKNDGTVWVCGTNSYGVLCTNDTTTQTSITQAQIDNVDYIGGYRGQYTVFLKKSGSVFMI